MFIFTLRPLSILLSIFRFLFSYLFSFLPLFPLLGAFSVLFFVSAFDILSCFCFLLSVFLLPLSFVLIPFPSFRLLALFYPLFSCSLLISFPVFLFSFATFLCSNLSLSPALVMLCFYLFLRLVLRTCLLPRRCIIPHLHPSADPRHFFRIYLYASSVPPLRSLLLRNSESALPLSRLRHASFLP